MSVPHYHFLLCFNTSNFEATGKSLLALSKRCLQFECVSKSIEQLKEKKIEMLLRCEEKGAIT